MSDHEKVRNFIREMTKLVSATTHDERQLVAAARPLLAELVATDDWLPDEFARPHGTYYQQYLLHCDPLERFSLASFVWGPGQSTPIHDHTVWGLIGMLRGAEISQAYALAGEGQPMRKGGEVRLEPGEIEGVSSWDGDIHRVENAHADRVSVSIHLYGGNIGTVRRHVYDPATGVAKPFVSGYASPHVPNFWVG